MPARQLRVMREQIKEETSLQPELYQSGFVLQLSRSGDVPEAVIESELKGIVYKHNEAYDSPGEWKKIPNAKELYNQGPFLYQVLDAGAPRLGGIYIPQAKREEVFQELQALGYGVEK